jgi:cation:H+ antiporter
MVTVFTWGIVAVIATAVIWKGSALLEDSSTKLSTYYELPEVVKGAIVVAVGSSFPELSTTVISTLVHGSFELGVSAIVGSAIFNILVIPGLAGIYSSGPLRANRDIVYKEAQFYMISVAVLLLTFSFAAIYNPVPSTDPDGPILGNVNRWLAIIPLATYGLYIFVQVLDTMDYDAPPQEEAIKPLKQWGLLILSLAIILLGVEGLVRAAVEFGAYFGTPDFLWGATVVAAGTSVPDAFVSVKAAKENHPVTSIANVLGSNVFDLLVAIPAGILIAGTATINYSVAAPMMGVLTLATIILFVILRTRMELSRGEAVILLVLYGVFVVWLGLESFDVVDLVPGLPPHTVPGH